MVNRWFGITCFFCMLSANTALLFRDFVPDWIAGEPPNVDALRVSPGETRESQVGIFNARGELVGRSWTILAADTDLVRVQSWTVLYGSLLPTGTRIPHVRIDIDLRYHERDYAEIVDVRLHWRDSGLPDVVLEGEYSPPDEFPCKWRVGDQRGTFVMKAGDTRALADVFRPFDRLPGLYVGRTWRVRLVDPLAQMLPTGDPADFGLADLLVTVDREETIEFDGRRVQTMHVASERAEAWVAFDGTVLIQKIDLPVVGELTLRHEPVDSGLRRTGLKSVHKGN